MTGWIRSLVRRYVKNEDIEERSREVAETLVSGKDKEAHALRRVASATGREDVARRAEKAEREASRLRRRLADDVAIDVFSERR